MANLHIIIKKKYFNQIVCGEKKTEYRLVTPYWVKRLIDRKYNNIIFQVGYRKDALRHVIPYAGYSVEIIRHEFFGRNEVSVFAIPLTDGI